MKKLSEVSKITGATRKALQEYEKMGLVKHTAETEGGYWLYDDDAIETIKIIVLFSKGLGVERKEIKKMLDDPKLDNFKNELTKAVEKLEERKKQIDGMIKFAESIKLGMESPSRYYKYFKTETKVAIDDEALALMHELSEEEIEKFKLIIIGFMKIIDLQRNKPEDRKLLDIINDLYITIIHIYEEEANEKIDVNVIYTVECFDGFVEAINRDFLPAFHINDEGIESINKAMESFKESIKKGDWNNKNA